MERKEIVHRFLENGVLLDPGVLDRISSMPAGDIGKLLEELLDRGVDVVGPGDLSREIPADPGKMIEVPVPRLEVQTETLAMGSDDRVDYLKHFQNRFDRIASILRKRKEYGEAGSILDVKSGGSRPVAVIGMVCDRGNGKSGGLEIEDGTGRIALNPGGTGLGAVPGVLVPDEVIGVRGNYNDGTGEIDLDQVDFPDIEEQDSDLSGEKIYAAFLSDLHFGSSDFMTEAFDKFIEFLGGKGGDPELGRIGSLTKFVVICGDLVHGEGEDLKSSYEGLASLLGRVPGDTVIFSVPGEHDTAGILEPQAGFLEDATGAFSRLDNFRTGSNPCMIKLASVPVLLYHGRSLVDWRENLGQMVSCDLMREMLVRRHLAPSYGFSVPLYPGAKDPFIIGDVPRIFHTGHEHNCCTSEYKGVLLLSTPSWMASEKLKGAGTAIVVDLSTLEASELNFAS